MVTFKAIGLAPDGERKIYKIQYHEMLINHNRQTHEYIIRSVAQQFYECFQRDKVSLIELEIYKNGFKT